MYRTALRTASRRIVSPTTVCRSSNRFVSTAPARKSRSWRGGALRWGLVAAGVYYYNTSNVFAEQPEEAIKQLDESIHHVQDSNLPTVDAVVEERRRRRAELAALEADNERRLLAENATGPVEESAEHKDDEEESEDSMDGLEEEAGQQGAFNPETGEINWDCPCLGGMANGPCGEQFKEAFSCFVYSKEEPKGVECIEKFKGMQDCFREHPDVYGAEMEDDEEEVEEELLARDAAQASQTTSNTSPEVTQASKGPVSAELEAPKAPAASEPHRDSQGTTAAEAQKLGDEGGELVPRAELDTSK